MKRRTFAVLATAVIAIGCRDQRLLQPTPHDRLAALILDGGGVVRAEIDVARVLGRRPAA